MLGQLLFLVLTRVVAGTQVSGIVMAVLDDNSTAASPFEVPAALSVSFTPASIGTALATINLPSGFLSNGNMNVGGGRRLEEDDSDFSGGSAAQRRLAAVCEAYGTATVSSNVLTVPVRKIGTASTPCDTAGTAISMVLTAGTASFSSLGTGQLDFTVQTDVDNTPVSVTFTVDGSGSFTLSAIGDPITWYQGQKYKFWFPPGEMMPMLETPEMTVWASVFQGPSIDFQWFDRFMVTGKDGHEYVDVRVRRHVPGVNRTEFRQNQFTQLDIKMSGRPIHRRGSQLFAAGDQVKVGVGSRTVNPPRLHHTPVLEFVMVESDSISFMVHASHAGAEFPDDFDKQAQDFLLVFGLPSEKHTPGLDQLGHGGSEEEWFQGHFATNLARPTTNTRSRGHADRSKQEGNGTLHCHGVNDAEQPDSIWSLPRYQMRSAKVVRCTRCSDI